MSYQLRLATLLFLALATSCGGEGDGDAKVDPREAVEGFDPATNARTEVGQVHAAAHEDPDALRAVALENLDATDPEVHWAAVYALSITATPENEESVSRLTEILSSSDVDERLNAAGSLAAMGDKEALPVLIDLLDSDAQLRYIVLPAGRVAGDMLLAYTQEDFGILEAEEADARAKLRAAWEEWWAEEGPSLQWQPDQGTFT